MCPRQQAIKHLLSRCVSLTCDLIVSSADSGKRKKKGSDLEQIDCTPPEHILPGSKERPLVPLQPQNKEWKVIMTVITMILTLLSKETYSS